MVAHLVTRRTAKLENALPASLMELALVDKISENSSRPCRPFVNLINAFCRLSIAPGPLPFGFLTGWAGARDSALLKFYLTLLRRLLIDRARDLALRLLRAASGFQTAGVTVGFAGAVAHDAVLMNARVRRLVGAAEI